jgi:protein SCO1/2
MTLTLAAALALGALVLVASSGRGDSAADDPLTAATGFAGSVLPEGVRAPVFSLRDQDGRSISMREFRGRPVIVTFLYTNCDETCPPQAQQIKGALAALDQRVPALAIAVDPSSDTPESARRFLVEQRMAGRMDFAVGSEEQLRPVWDAFAVQPQEPAAEHQARIVLVDGDGRQRVAFPLDQATPERIAHDVRVLEAG